MFSEDYASLGTFFLFCPVVILLLVNRVRMPTALKIKLARILFQLKSWGWRKFSRGYSGQLREADGLRRCGDWQQLYSVVSVLRAATARVPVRGPTLGWDDIAPAPTLSQTVKVGVPGIRQGLRSCSCCTAVLPADVEVCPRCETKGHVRRKIACNGPWRCW